MEEKQNEILIVDDNPEILRFLSTVLKKEGYKVRIAKNGKQALTYIVESEPDLLLLDVHMPEMDGLEVCETIKGNPCYKNLPIIFISGLDDKFNKVQGLEAGAVDYVAKPFDVGEVRLRVKTHLRLRKSLLELDQLKAELTEKNKELARLKRKPNS